MMSVVALYKKMLGFNPNFKTVLEIGPGCGYLSFLLKNHKTLENYSQIEACESYYILQNLVNLQCFGTRFDERVLLDPEVRLADFMISQVTDVMEIAVGIHLHRTPPLAAHYPWWRIGELVSEERRFNIVTSNANLLEFSPPALNDYLTLVGGVLEPDGIFIAQCFGFHANGNSDTLLDTLRTKGFVPLIYARENKPFRYPAETRPPTLGGRITGNAVADVLFPVNNALLIRQGHPLYEKYNADDSFKLDFIAPEPLVDAIYFQRPPHRRKYSLQELVADLERSLRL